MSHPIPAHHGLVRTAVLALAPALAGLGIAVLATGAAALPAPGPATTAVTPHLAADDEDTAGAGTVTWALEPANADGPDGRISLRHEVAAGGTLIDAVALTNYSSAPATFDLYAGSGTVTSGGDFDIVHAEPGGVGDAAWVTVGPLDGGTPIDGGVRVELPPSSAVVVPLTVRVPGNATPGDHPVGVVAELVGAEEDVVRLAARVGVRLHLRVTGDVVPRLAPDEVTATWEPSWNPFAPGTLRVEYAVANDGNVRLGAETIATAEGPFGAGAVTATGAAVREVLPGQSVPGVVEASVWPLVRTVTEITVTPGVVGEDDVDAALQPVTVSVTTWTVPWSQLAGLAVLVGAVLLVRWLRRRAAARTQARIDAAVAAATRSTHARGEPPAASAEEGARPSEVVAARSAAQDPDGGAAGTPVGEEGPPSTS